MKNPNEPDDERERHKARASGAGMLSRRPLSKSTLIEKLTEKGYAAPLAQETAEWLESIGALDDAQYAELLAQRYRARGYGQYRIQNELKRHGIDSETAAQALGQLPESDDAIDRFIRSRLKGEKPDRMQLKRLSDALFRKGFGWDEIREAIDRYMNTEETDEWPKGLD